MKVWKKRLGTFSRRMRAEAALKDRSRPALAFLIETARRARSIAFVHEPKLWSNE